MMKQFSLIIYLQGDFLEFTEKFKEKYGENIILSKCKENNCSLKDIKKEDYLIVNGDQFKKNSNEKSVDCIIIDLNQNLENKYRIILCELTAGKKPLSDCKNKFQSSGEYIVQTMNDIDESIYEIDCLMIGKIKENGRTMAQKALTSSIRIKGYARPIYIKNKECGFSISNLN